MARGFESKDVEFQQAEAERPRTPGAGLSPEDRARTDRCRTLELALSRARSERDATASPLRRDMLTRAIRDLERQLSDVALADHR